MTLPGLDVVTCGVCGTPVALSLARAFESGRNEHDEPVYAMSCANCTWTNYGQPMEAALRELAPELIAAGVPLNDLEAAVPLH